MKLILKGSDFKRIDEKSSYNHNYYKYIGKDGVYYTEILEICYEDYNFCSYSLIKDDIDIFLGCSEGYLKPDDDSVVEIDFQLYYT